MNIKLISIADTEIKTIHLYVLDISVRVIQLNREGHRVHEYAFAKTDLEPMLNHFNHLGYFTEEQHMEKYA